jgi:hypothetical protein
VISLQTPTQGVTLRGHVISDLPTSVIDALNTATQIRSGKVFHTVIRKVYGTNRVVVGSARLRIKVRSEVDQ